MSVFPSSKLFYLLEIIDRKLLLLLLAPRLLNPLRSWIITASRLFYFTSFHPSIAAAQGAVDWDSTLGHHCFFGRLWPLKFVLIRNFSLYIVLLQERRNFWWMVVQVISKLNTTWFHLCLFAGSWHPLILCIAHWARIVLMEATFICLWCLWVSFSLSFP